MEVIDGKWIAARLDSGRGSKAALADALGVRPDVVSKILSGTRRVQPDEIPKVVAFFETAIDDLTRQLLARIEQLDAQERGFLLAAAEGMLARHPAEDS